MAVTLASDFTIYNEQFWSGFNEQLEQNIDGFNAASNNALILLSRMIKGNYEQQSYMKYLSGLVTRRDTTSTAAVTPLKLQMGENASVKLSRKIGPVDATYDAFKKAGLSIDDFSFLLGQKAAMDVPQEQLNTALLSVYAALSGVAALIQDSSTLTISHIQMAKAMAKLGDKASRLACWVMHSTSYFDLVQQSIADKIFEVAGATIYSGTPATFGRPVLVTDSSSLIISGSPDQYITLGLVQQAAEVIKSEDETLVIDEVTGNANLIKRYQGEYAYNLGVKGFTWDIANGGANPDGTALGTSTNWDKTAADNKSCCGVVLKTIAIS